MEQRSLLTVRVGAEVLAFPVAAVKEIVPMLPVTRLPDAPAWLLGTIDVRGDSVPVVDLAARLSLEPTVPSLRTPIVLIACGEQHVGFLVEEALDAAVQSDALAPPPEAMTHAHHPLEGVARTARGAVPVLRVEMLCRWTAELSLPAQSDSDGS